MGSFSTEIAVIAAMLVFNAAFAAYEMALASVSKARIQHLKEKGAPGAASAHFMKERLEAGLSLIQLGITLAGAVAAATGGAGVNEALSPFIASRFGLAPGTAETLAITLFVLPLSFVTIIFGELVPKIFAIENKEFVLLKLSPAFRALYFACYPLLAVFEAAVKAAMAAANRLMPKKDWQEKAAISELKLAAAQARAERLIGPLEEKIVNAAAMLSLRTVDELAVPAAAFSYIPITMSLPDALVRAHLDLHTRFPVTRLDGAPGEVVGYVNFKDIVNALKMQAPSADVAGITRPMEKVRAGTPASKALEEMIARNAHMAVVCADDGTVTGLLTVEDITAQLFGARLKDEYDRLPSHLYAAGGGIIAGGAADMAAVMIELGLKPEAGNVQLSAWVERQLGRPPQGSDVVRAGPVEVIVRKTRRHRVSEAFVRKAPGGPAI